MVYLSPPNAGSLAPPMPDAGDNVQRSSSSRPLRRLAFAIVGSIGAFADLAGGVIPSLQPYAGSSDYYATYKSKHSSYGTVNDGNYVSKIAITVENISMLSILQVSLLPPVLFSIKDANFS